jgi:hypothetical protein
VNEYDVNGETIWEASKKLKQQARDLLAIVKEREAEKLKKGYHWVKIADKTSVLRKTKKKK